MSCADDSEFVRQLMRQNELFVAKQMAEMRKLISEQKKNNDELTKRVDVIESTPQTCNCTAQVKRALAAVLAQMDEPALPDRVSFVDEVLQLDLTQRRPMFSTSTPQTKKRKQTHTVTSEEE